MVKYTQTKKKILIISNSVQQLYLRLNLIKELKKNYEIVCFAPFDVKLIRIKNIIFKNFKLSQRGTNLFKELNSFIDLYKTLKNQKPDIILNFTIKPNLYCSIISIFLKIKFINNITGLGIIFLKSNLTKLIGLLIYKIFLSRANHTFFQNKSTKDKFNSKNIIFRNKSSLIPGSGVNLNKFKNVKQNKKKITSFLFVGRYIREKGIEELLDAIIELNKKKTKFKIFIILAGDNFLDFNILNKLQDVRKFKNVTFVASWVNDIRKYLNKVDCVVLPSYSEGMARILLEGAASKKILLASRIEGCQEIVHENFNGFTFLPRNKKDLTQKMLKVIDLKSKKKLLKYFSNSSKIAKNFDEKLVINKYSYIIKKIINE